MGDFCLLVGDLWWWAAWVFTAKLLAPGYDGGQSTVRIQGEQTPTRTQSLALPALLWSKTFLSSSFPPAQHNRLILAPLQVLSLFYSNVQWSHLIRDKIRCPEVRHFSPGFKVQTANPGLIREQIYWEDE